MSKPMLWTGRIISALPALFLLVSGINLSLVQSPAVRESFAKFGYSPNVIAPLGILEAILAILYMIPQTSMLGAILLTGYLGGATATHVRINDPTWVVPVVVGVLLWLGLYLRDEKLRALVPLRRRD